MHCRWYSINRYPAIIVDGVHQFQIYVVAEVVLVNKGMIEIRYMREAI